MWCKPTSNDHRGYPRCVVNVIERIVIEQHEVGYLISFDGADGVEFAEKFCCVSSGCFQRLHRREASSYQVCELIMDGAILGARCQVRPGKESYTTPLHHDDNFRILSKQAICPTKVLGCVLRRAVGPQRVQRDQSRTLPCTILLKTT